MTLTPFNDGWTVRSAGKPETQVTLPHDAMIGERRSAEAPSGSHGGYFPGGRYTYSRRWAAPDDAGQRRLALVFEGVYGQTVVRVNGETVAECPTGYREFVAPLESVLAAGIENLIEVEVDNSALPNSRWYTGSGIYRPVWLESVAPVRIARDGIAVVTRSIDGPAVVDVAVTIEGLTDAVAQVTASLEDPDGKRVSATASVVGSHAELRLEVDGPWLWSDLTPHLYTAVVAVEIGGVVVDSRTLAVGLRTIQVDARSGLRVNGEQVLLRGACVHHDSGILGAVTLRASEFRRARILKESGFNAIRSSHNPLSRDLLDACDELGLYVLDELTDVWFAPKSAHDVAPLFEGIWRDDARSMVAKDRNHPSVIMYSIGNEVAESGTQRGIEAAHAISGFIRELDPHRPTTIAINFLLNVMAASGRSLFDTTEHDPTRVVKQPSAATSTMANILANRIGVMMQTVSRLPKADKVSRDTFTAVDVAGYNYAWGRYAGDARRHPDRVVLGTESMPGDIPKIWPLAKQLPNVIGDFVWTGWDYLGESGIGTWSYGSQPAEIGKKYPELTAGCGLIDITGHPGAALLLSQAAWGQLEAPRIAVRPLDRSGEKVRRIAWRSSDAIESWAWSGANGKLADIEVYSADDSVELLLNGRSIGRKALGTRLVARFRVPYQPGELVAIGYRDGAEVSRSSLKSAGTQTLRARVEDVDAACAFIRIEVADEHGVVEMLADDVVSVEVTGGAVLAALGSGATATDESFTDGEHRTYYGRALAILRFTDDADDVLVTVTSQRHGSATAVVSAWDRSLIAAGGPGGHTGSQRTSQ